MVRLGLNYPDPFACKKGGKSPPFTSHIKADANI